MNRPLVSRQTPLRVSSQPIRYLNELRALDVLFREGGQSRADLARTLGLNRSTTGNIITNLMADSLVLEQTGPKQESAVLRTGRPGIEVSLDPRGAIFVGAAFEADRLMALMVDLSGTIVRWKTTAFQTAQSRPEQAAKAMAKLINALVTAEPERDHVYGICVAVPAMFEDGVILQATLLGWRNVDLRPLISAHLSRDIPVSVENDANAFAIAETYRGPSPTGGTVAFILIDSGAGGGIVNGGRILRGGAGLAGEFGHLRVGRGGFVRGRGGKGRLETYIGREAVVARYRANGGAAGAELADLVAALERGDVAATRTAKEWAHWFAMGLLSIVNIVNPSLIIVGGPVSAVLKFAMKDVEAKLRANLPRGFPAPKITLSRFGPEGPAYGAALLRHQRAFSIDESALYPSGNGRSLFPKLDS